MIDTNMIDTKEAITMTQTAETDEPTRNEMLRITDLAATVIANACRAHHLPRAGGLRIAPRGADGTRPTVDSLVIDFVESAHPADTLVREGRATVFLADGVDRVVADRVLDVDGGVKPPQLVLRAPGAHRRP